MLRLPLDVAKLDNFKILILIKKSHVNFIIFLVFFDLYFMTLQNIVVSLSKVIFYEYNDWYYLSDKTSLDPFIHNEVKHLHNS